jgi:hypothetical protein
MASGFFHLEVSAPADTTTITIPDTDSVHGLAYPDVPVAIPVTVTADGKAHTGVPMDIPEDTVSDGGSIWDGGVNHSTSVHITNIMTSEGGVSSLVEVVGYPALHLPVLASSFGVGLQPLNLHRRISNLVRKQNARAQREHVRGVAAANEPASMSDLTQTDAAEVVTDDQEWAAVASLHKLKLRDDGAEISTPLHPEYCWAKTLAPLCEYLEWREHSCMDQICIYQRFSWLDSATLIDSGRSEKSLDI